MNTPKESQPKDLPIGKLQSVDVPAETTLNKKNPEETPVLQGSPDESPILQTKPDETPKIEIVPDASPKKEEMPSDYIEDNCVMVGDKKIEIKPTKLKYFRNKAASAYGIIKAVPLHELLTYGKGVIDEKRDADQLLYDFLVAAFDDSDLVKNNYDEFDADTIDRICKIFGRINHIDEKEEQARKNREAQVKR